VAAPLRDPEEDDHQDGAEAHRVQAAFGSEGAAADRGGAGGHGVEQALRGAVAGDLGAEDRGGGDVPAEVQADRQPQVAGGDEGGAEHAAGLHCDGDRAPQGGVRVDQMRQSEQEACGRQGDPGAEARFDDAEQDAAVEQFLRDGGGGHEAEQSYCARGRSEAVDGVVPEEGDVGDDGAEHGDAEDGAESDPAGRARRCQLGDRAVFGAAHDPPVDEHRDRGRGEAGDQHQPRPPFEGDHCISAEEGDRADGQQLPEEFHRWSFRSPAARVPRLR
jgi:hypothetical protein